VGVIGLIGIAVAAWFLEAKRWSNDDVTHGADGSAARALEPLTVETVRMSPGGIVRTSTQIGSVHAFEDADLFAKVSGYLKVLKVDYGDHVKEGQLLAEIDDPEVVKEAERAASALHQTKAAVQQANARIDSAIADKKAAEAAVDQARADIDRYTSLRKYRKLVLIRYQDLVARNAVPQQLADEAEENFASAVAGERAAHAAETTAKAQAAAAEAKVEQARADLAEAEANVQVAEANLAKARVFVDYTRIISPYNGVITKRNFFRGAFIRSASEGNTVPLLSVARTDLVRVVTYVPDRDVPFLDVGDSAEVTLDALGNQVLRGKVSRFADAEDPTSRTMYTEIDLQNPDDRIRPGMYGIAKIILEKGTKKFTIPSSCLVGESNNGKASVFTIKDGKAHLTEIAVGADDGIRVEVLSGLSSTDEVIMSHGGIVEGMPVRAVERAKTSTEGGRAGQVAK
jgi:RND family efflux transporter MFP subunit